MIWIRALLTITNSCNNVAYTTTMSKEAKKGAPIAEMMSAECIAVRVRYVGRVITSIYDRVLRKFDIKVNQASILVYLTIHNGAGPGNIGTALQMEKSTVSRNLDRMRKKGWIEVEPRNQGLSQVVRVTETGDRLLLAVHREWQKAQASARELLGSEGVQSINALFDTLRKHSLSR
jgi:DNA-binding MarR family transcriptional regulator